MPSFRPDRTALDEPAKAVKSSDFTQLGLDFSLLSGYSNVPRKETKHMNNELLESLDGRINALLEKYSALKNENARLAEENERYKSEREGLKSRVDAMLGKLEDI
jgi:cell division protein ZapB